MITLVSPSPVWKWGVCLGQVAVATLNPNTMETLQLFRGDTIIVRYVAFNDFGSPR